MEKRKMFKWFFSWGTGLMLSCSLPGCTSIPRAAPELSTELGNKLSAIETSHLQLLKMFFAQKRETVDEFVTKEWTPVFAEEFFRNPTIQESWEEVVKSRDKHERLQFLLIVGPAIQQKINSKRQELIKPLDDLEREITVSLQQEYNQARSINNTVTSFLFSASKVAENQQRYLNMLGLTENKINRVIDQTDHVVDQLVSTGEQVQEKEKQVRDFVQELKSIKESLPLKR